jgi:hypothetical protein
VWNRKVFEGLQLFCVHPYHSASGQCETIKQLNFMGKLKDNLMMDTVGGKVGKQVVFRNFRGKTVVGGSR